MTDMMRDVDAFYRKYGFERMARASTLTALSGMQPEERVRHMSEELGEFQAGVRGNDVARQADALADLVYVALGTAWMMGLPWEPIWDAVHAANMAKVPAPDRAKRVAKPAGWRDPIDDIRLLVGSPDWGWIND